MIISLCHATFHSPIKPKEIKALWLEKSIKKSLIEYIPGLNEDDYAAIENTKYLKRFISPKTNQCTAVNNWNGSARITSGDLIFVIADDLIPPFGWDEKLREICSDINPKKYSFAIKINDSNSILDTKMRHPIISRKFYEEFGLFDDKFRGVFCDDDITKRAFWKSLIIDGRELEFIHGLDSNKLKIKVKNKVSNTKSKILLNKKSEYEYGFKIIQENWRYRKLFSPTLLLRKKPKFLPIYIYSNITFIFRFFSSILLLLNFIEMQRVIKVKLKRFFNF